MNRSISSYVFVNRCFTSVLALALISVLGSLCSEIVFEMKPCFLCKLQRLGLVILICASIGGLFFAKKHYFIMICFIVSLGIACLSLYHYAVQNGFLLDPCTVATPTDLESLRNSILKNNYVSCSSMHSIFGVPLSFLSFSFSILCLMVAWIAKKRPLSID